MDNDEKRIRILQAAREVCARSGYEAARMDEIAACAHVSKGTLYNYFDSKEHLFLSTVLLSYEEGERTIDAEVGSDADPMRQLESQLEALVKTLPLISEVMPVNFQVWGVVTRDAKARQRMFDALRAIYAERSSSLAGILEQGSRSGCFNPDLDVPAVVRGVHAIFDGFVYRSTFDPSQANPDRLRECLHTLIHERVLANAEVSHA